MSTFEQHVDEYRDALRDWYNATRDLDGAREMATRYANTLRDTEADIIANGGTGGISIDGKNAEQRKAQLDLAKAQDSVFQQASAQHELAKRAVAEHEANRDEAAHRMALCKRLMDYAIADAQLRAAHLSGNAAEPALSR